MADPEYELFAIRYATRKVRRGDQFIGGDPHDGPMPMASTPAELYALIAAEIPSWRKVIEERNVKTE